MPLTQDQFNAKVVAILNSIPQETMWRELSFIRCFAKAAVDFAKNGTADDKEAAKTLIRKIYAAGGWGGANDPVYMIKNWLYSFFADGAEPNDI